MKDNKLSTQVISFDVKKLGISILLLFGIIICFFIVFKTGLGKINKQKTQIKKLETDIATLSKKYQTLLTVEETLANDIQFFSLALPDSNPSLILLYQVKTFSLQNGLFFKNIKSGAESKSKNYSKVDLNFELTGNLDAIFMFLETIKNSAPIVTLDKFVLKQSTGTHKANIGLTSYWASFPEKIPAITQPIGDFTQEEMDIITKISQLSVPQFSAIYSQEPGTRQNPFE